ncbi:MAG: RidA family protein [Nocardioidaceae bacterium]
MVTRQVTTFGFGMPWEESHGYSQAFRVGQLVCISGQVPHDEQGELVGIGNAARQTQAVFANLDRALSGIGASRRQVVETVVMVVDLAVNFASVSSAHQDYFRPHRPASTALGVAALVIPGQLVEISARVSLDLPR